MIEVYDDSDMKEYHIRKREKGKKRQTARRSRTMGNHQERPVRKKHPRMNRQRTTISGRPERSPCRESRPTELSF